MQLKIAKDYFYQEKIDSCISYLNNVIKIDSTNSEAFYYIAKANYQIDNFVDGLKYLNLAEKNKFDLDSIQMLKLQILFAQENYEDYIAICNRLITKNTSDYKMYFRKATALYNQGNTSTSNELKDKKLKEALDAINTSLNLNKKDYEVYVLRGAIRIALSDNKGALDDIDIAIKNEKKDSSIIFRAYLYKSSVMQGLDNLTYSESLLDTSISYNPKHSILYIVRGDIRSKLNKVNFACDDYRKALELGDNDAIEKIREKCK